MQLALAWTAIKKHYRPGGSKNKYLFLRVLESGKFKIRVPAHSVSVEGQLPSS